MTTTTVTINNRLYKFVGTTDDVTNCGCCGRTNLKMTVVLQHIDNGNPGEFVFFGSGCAAKAVGWATKDVAKTANAAERERHQAILVARRVHPLQRVIDDEINAANAAGVRFNQRPMARWNELTRQIHADVEMQYGKW